VLTASKPYDVIILVETWLSGDISNAELGLAYYSLFRLDRNLNTSVHTRGGGVLIAVKSDFFCREIETSVDCVEQIFVDIHFEHKHLIIGAVYIPPSSDIAVYDAHCKAIENIISILPNADTLIIGDYNLPNTRWFNESNGSLQYTSTGICTKSRQADIIYSYFNEFNFYQHNTILNARGNTLDLLFSNLRFIHVHAALESLLSNDVFHPPLVFSLPTPCVTSVTTTNITKFDFKRANFYIMKDYLNNINWDMELRDLDVNDAVNSVYSHLDHIIQSCVPSFAISRSSYPTWFSKELVSIINNKRRAHFKFKCTGEYSDYLAFSHLRSTCKALRTKCWNKYINKTECAINNNPRAFWSFIKTTKAVKSPSYINTDNGIINNNFDIANCFADFFESAYRHSDADCNELELVHDLNLMGMDITISEIFTYLNRLNLFSSPGLDGIPPVFFKSCNFIMSRILWILFNKSLSAGVFPDPWKICIVTPTFKGGDRHQVSNFRPISKQNIMPKIFENIIADKLSCLFKNILITEQHGFIPGRSTTTNLLLYHDYINTALENRTQVDAIYTDFSKAFDTVNHSILKKKLFSYGVGGSLLSWLQGFITNRYQLIKFNDFFSRYIEVPSGVPQGSHLGPLLFNIFINDISKVLNYSKLLLYADDLKIFRQVRTAVDAHRLQQDLDNLNSWSITNKLHFNISKCHIVHFSRSSSVLTFTYSLNGVALTTVDEVRDLGVTFHSDLSFGRHIQLIAASAFRMLGYINRCAKFFKHAETLKLLYCTLVRSRLEYASMVWDPYQQNHNLLLERIQHRFLRSLSFKLNKPMKFTDHNYDHLLADLNLMTLANRRILLGLSLLQVVEWSY